MQVVTPLRAGHCRESMFTYVYSKKFFTNNEALGERLDGIRM